MPVKPRRHELVERIIRNDLLLDIGIVNIDTESASLIVRKVPIKIDLKKLPKKPSMNDVLYAIDVSYGLGGTR